MSLKTIDSHKKDKAQKQHTDQIKVVYFSHKT